MAILKKIKYAIHQKELDAKRRSIAQDKRAREQAIKIRKEIAAGLERQYLDNGADVYVTTSGSNHTTLRIKWVLMSRPEVYDTINRTREMDTFKALGFKEIVFKWIWRCVDTSSKLTMLFRFVKTLPHRKKIMGKPKGQFLTFEMSYDTLLN